MKVRDPHALRILEYTTRELSSRTWRDFERLFQTHPAPGAYPCWCMHNHQSGPMPEQKEAPCVTRSELNHQQKKQLTECGSSHGILVYAQGEPVGWCQYGLKEELPRIDNNPGYRRLASPSGRLWRITCFVVHRKYRRNGVARTALKAALHAIQEQGGGLVEAYPIKHWGAYSEYRGTASMFEKEGFQMVATLGKSNVLMRKMI
jgi:GNAT superfamily N-acetyltransferase